MIQVLLLTQVHELFCPVQTAASSSCTRPRTRVALLHVTLRCENPYLVFDGIHRLHLLAFSFAFFDLGVKKREDEIRDDKDDEGSGEPHVDVITQHGEDNKRLQYLSRSCTEDITRAHDDPLSGFEDPSTLLIPD